MSSETVVIGSRESRLAVIQSEMVRDYIEKNNKGLKAELLTMKTTGDIILDRTLDKVGEGLVCKRAGPGASGRKKPAFRTQSEGYAHGSPGGTASSGFLKREDPRDALVLPEE